MLAVFNKIIKVQESYFAEVKKINQVATINIAVAKDDTTHEGHLETDTISLFIPNTANLNYFELYYLFAHEYLHSWFSPELFSLDKMPEAQIYWYTEGFTDFFTFVTLSMVSQINQTKLVDKLNEALFYYYTDLASSMPNAVLARYYWQNQHKPNIDKQPYIRGMLLANKWGAQLSLKFLKNLNELHKVKPATLAKVGTNIVGDKFQVDVHNYIDNGAIFSSQDNYAALCKLVTPATISYHAPGFLALENNKSEIVAFKVLPHSQVYIDGLREGDKIVAADYYLGATQEPRDIFLRQLNNTQQSKELYSTTTEFTINLPVCVH